MISISWLPLDGTQIPSFRRCLKDSLNYRTASHSSSAPLHRFFLPNYSKAPGKLPCLRIPLLKTTLLLPRIASIPQPRDSLLSGLEDVVTGYIFGKKKATEVAHLIWKNVVRKGDVVVDATCGNGFDTLALLKLIGDRTHSGRVYAMDLQKNALERTSSLLDQSVSPDERELVELYALCHTKMEEVVPQGVAVRLVAFNLGYLPGGDKRIKTQSETTLLALEAAAKILAPGGLISLVVYVGHSGGREELDRVQSFASGLSANNWACCNLQMLNRPSAPVLVLLSKR